MKNKITQEKKRNTATYIKRAILICLCVITLATAVMFSYAYFTKMDVYNAMLGAEIDMMFDKLTPEALETYQAHLVAEGNVKPQEPEDGYTWGSKWNPYIIDQPRHLNNLSALQNVGYFYKEFISQNTYTDGKYTSGGKMPYFLVCDNKTGGPVCIEAEATPIEPVGTHEFPFIGSIKGAFVTTADPCYITYEENGVKQTKSSASSAIHGAKVTCAVTSPDIGLFGYISCLGDESNVNEKNEFPGVVTEITDLLLSDIQVSVKSPIDWNFPENILNHLFSYKNKTETEGTTFPKETHHIGIGFGHIEYVKLKNISVYYSADSILAMDLSDVGEEFESNYMSTTGIVGFLYNMNPKMNEERTHIIKGSGVNNDQILSDTISGGVTIPGGGLMSGTEKGYVWASDVYKNYHWIKNTENNTTTYPQEPNYPNGPIDIKDAYKENGDPLCYQEMAIDPTANGGYSGTGKYYFYDGVFTFALSTNAQDKITSTWDGSPDQFTVGTDSDDAWDRIDTDGDPNVLAFLKKITTDGEFYTAVEDGKQLIISYDLGDGKTFFMTLNEISDGDNDANSPDNAFYTPGQLLNFFPANDPTKNNDVYDKLFAGLGTAWRPDWTDASNAPTIEEFRNNFSDYTIIDLGNTSESLTTQGLKDRYTIEGNASTEHMYLYYGTSTEASVIMNESNVPVMVGSTVEWTEGYFTVESGKGDYMTWWGDTVYYLVWHPLDGASEVSYFPSFQDPNKPYWTDYDQFNDADALLNILKNNEGGTDLTYVLPSSSSPQSNRWGNETLYTLDDHTGPIIDTSNNNKILNYNGSTIDPDSNQAQFATGKILTYSSDSKPCFVRDIVTGQLTINGAASNATIIDGKLTNITYDEETGLYTYGSGNSAITGEVIDKIPKYKISAWTSDRTLQLLPVSFYPDYGGLSSPSAAVPYYLLWNGVATDYDTEAEIKNHFDLEGFRGEGSNHPNGRLPIIDGSGAVQYATVRFNNETCSFVYSSSSVVRYVSYGNQRFESMIAADATKDDKAEAKVKMTIYTLEATKEGTSSIHAVLPLNPDGTQNYNANEHILFATAANKNAEASRTFELVSVETLRQKKNEGGKGFDYVSNTILSKKFQMSEQIKAGTSVDIYGVVSSTENLVRAPVGSNGVEAIIPQSCIAFRMNSSGEKVIQVIVAIPTSALEGAIAPVCYFNLWYFEQGAGWQSGVTQEFNPANYEQRFYMPISLSTNTLNDYVNVTVNGTQYRTYLNGKQVLVACEFPVKNEGIYLLGATGYDTANNNAALNVPTQIVYFAADSVSSGDGEIETEDEIVNNESRMGTIDFVYDNGSNIILVAEKSTIVGGNKDYSQYFYPTYSILYFDNNVKNGEAFDKVNTATVYIRRTADGSSATLKRYLLDPKYIKINAYSPNSDAEAAISPPQNTTQ